MVLVKRWFMETTEGEAIDGPFKKESDLDTALNVHARLYKYVPVKTEREIDVTTHKNRGIRNERHNKI